MNTYEEKLSLLAEMIAFAVIDGKLHDREYQFLSIVANELQIKKEDFKNLFHEELKPIPMKSEAQRIQQFYRLALLMYCDGVLHEKEEIAIKQMGVNMGLNPFAIKRILKAMEKSPTRMIDGERALLFGPFAGFSTRFLKNGSYMDLPMSIKTDNIMPMLAAGYHNIPLTKYLIEQVRQSPKDRMNALREYLPNAKSKDWKLERAGQRVQVIKKDEKEGGILEFGTEVINTEDGTLAVLLGASPGASTAVSIMVGLINKCFKDKVKTPEWNEKFKAMIPSYGQTLNDKPELLAEIRKNTATALKLNN